MPERHEVEIEWWFAATAALMAMRWRDAEQVDAAVQRFAATGQGRVTKMKTEPWGLWLWVLGYKVRLRFDPSRRLISVLYIWRIE